MVSWSLESAVPLKPNDHLRRVPELLVRARIDDLLTDVRSCTLRELSIFGRGFNPGTSSINLSAFNKDRMIYKDFLINNLSPDLYERFLVQLALIFGCSVEQIKEIGTFCYNVHRGYERREDVPAISFQMGISEDGYVRAVGNQEGDKWVYIGE